MQHRITEFGLISAGLQLSRNVLSDITFTKACCLEVLDRFILRNLPISSRSNDKCFTLFDGVPDISYLGTSIPRDFAANRDFRHIARVWTWAGHIETLNSLNSIARIIGFIEGYHIRVQFDRLYCRP